MNMKIILISLLLTCVLILTTTNANQGSRRKSSEVSPLDTLPAGIYNEKPLGSLFLYTSYFDNTIDSLKNKRNSYFGLFSNDTTYHRFYDLTLCRHTDFSLKKCNFTIVKDSSYWKPFNLKIDVFDSLGAPLLLLKGIELNEMDSVKTIFSGRQRLISGTGNKIEMFQTFCFDTPEGSLKIYPDTSLYVKQHRRYSHTYSDDYFIVPYYVSFKEKKTLIRKNIQFGDDGDPSIIWVGDLDQDNIPDLMIDVNKKYSMNEYLLLLSSIARENELYGLAGKFTDYAD